MTNSKLNKIGVVFISAMITVVGFAVASGEIANWSTTQNGTVRVNRVSAGVNSIEADRLLYFR